MDLAYNALVGPLDRHGFHKIFGDPAVGLQVGHPVLANPIALRAAVHMAHHPENAIRAVFQRSEIDRE